jgi:bifunctional DNA-binding transcriptional regulator/antitoxin component of YhaV-PrlF toxin-antitoxin module
MAAACRRRRYMSNKYAACMPVSLAFRGPRQLRRHLLSAPVDHRGDDPGLIARVRPGATGVGGAAARPGATVTGGASGTGAGPDSRISREDPGLREDQGDSRAPEAPRSPDPPGSFRPAIRVRGHRGTRGPFARARERAPAPTPRGGWHSGYARTCPMALRPHSRRPLPRGRRQSGHVGGLGRLELPVHTMLILSHTMNAMEGTQVKVSRNGQVSVPASVRHRWGTSTVLIIDRGDYAIVRPVPDDPIEALRGAYATPGPATDDARSSDRAAEAASDDRRQDRAG